MITLRQIGDSAVEEEKESKIFTRNLVRQKTFTHPRSPITVKFHSHIDIDHHLSHFYQWSVFQGGEEITRSHNLENKLHLENYMGLPDPVFTTPPHYYRPWSYDGTRFYLEIEEFGPILYNFSTREYSLFRDLSWSFSVICAPKSERILIDGRQKSTNKRICAIYDFEGNILHKLDKISNFDRFESLELGWEVDEQHIWAIGCKNARAQVWIYVFDGQNGKLIKKKKFKKLDYFPYDLGELGIEEDDEIKIRMPFGSDAVPEVLDDWAYLHWFSDDQVLKAAYYRPISLIRDNESAGEQVKIVQSELVEAHYFLSYA